MTNDMHICFIDSGAQSSSYFTNKIGPTQFDPCYFKSDAKTDYLSVVSTNTLKHCVIFSV